jgi:hypothetical protein
VGPLLLLGCSEEDAGKVLEAQTGQRPPVTVVVVPDAEPILDAAPPATCVPRGATETCNGIDDDCDGRTDEDAIEVGQAFGSAVGECVQGTFNCVRGTLTCRGAVEPRPETCADLDLDCDGAVGEGRPELGGCLDDGADCETSDRCRGGECLDDLGDRYCSRPCDADADCGGLRCAETPSTFGTGSRRCLRVRTACGGEGDCADDLVCQRVPRSDGDDQECRRPDPDALPGGAPCDANDECASRACGFEPPHCVDSCVGDADCSEGTTCVRFATADDDELGRCVRACGERDAECPQNTACVYSPPFERGAAQVTFRGWCRDYAADARAFGEACANHDECRSLWCIDERCTKGCRADLDCTGGTLCGGERRVALGGGVTGTVRLCEPP